MRRDPVRQVAYFVPDMRAAARAHSALYGSGPYFVADNIPLTLCRYRGQPGKLDHSSAYGQWGEVMIEFVQQNNPEPSVFFDMYPKGGTGIHHVALIVDDIHAAMRHFTAQGFEEGLYAEVMPGAGFAMMDTVKAYGHFTELYEPSPPLLGVYDLVKRSSEGFDGTDVIRPFSF
jgi:catechol 2,3-dioxygenase-like lactoylglutathione lyase family enzyme